MVLTQQVVDFNHCCRMGLRRVFLTEQTSKLTNAGLHSSCIVALSRYNSNNG